MPITLFTSLDLRIKREKIDEKLKITLLMPINLFTSRQTKFHSFYLGIRDLTKD